MSEDLDSLASGLDQLATALPPVPPVNGRFTDPRQIARVMREMDGEDWQYCGSRHVGGHGDVQIVACGNRVRPLFKDTAGTWHVCHEAGKNYGSPDRTATLLLLTFAQKH